ncbi:MAG: glycyl-radical enzyme activating protein [Candidatus Lokiarchaeota archaeon]|nr:glycyl-radical enzyme activating protein [Candidatus Harpocratesius repetitus]
MITSTDPPSSDLSSIKQFSEKKAYIFEIQRLSTEDGPGIRTTVFFKKCPLKCKWCHNPESIEFQKAIQWFENKCIGCEQCIEQCSTHSLSFSETGLVINRKTCSACGDCAEICPTTALKVSGEWITLNNLINEVLKDKTYYSTSNGGVTCSGGEPTQQIEFLSKFLQECKKNGIHTALDTCGYATVDTYSKILPYVDLILYDIKEIDPQRHKEYTGVSNQKILQNLEWLAEKIRAGASFKLWIRTPIIPQFTARDENIKGIARFIHDKLGDTVERWDLLAFNNMAQAKYERLNIDWPLRTQPLMTKDEMNHFLQIAYNVGVKQVQWDGPTKI